MREEIEKNIYEIHYKNYKDYISNRTISCLFNFIIIIFLLLFLIYICFSIFIEKSSDLFDYIYLTLILFIGQYHINGIQTNFKNSKNLFTENYMIYPVFFFNRGVEEKGLYYSFNYNEILSFQIIKNNLIIILKKDAILKGAPFNIKNLSQEELQKIEEILQSKGVKKLEENTSNQN